MGLTTTRRPHLDGVCKLGRDVADEAVQSSSRDRDELARGARVAETAEELVSAAFLGELEDADLRAEGALQLERGAHRSMGRCRVVDRNEHAREQLFRSGNGRVGDPCGDLHGVHLAVTRGATSAPGVST